MFQYCTYFKTKILCFGILLSVFNISNAIGLNLAELIPDPKYTPAEVVEIQMSALKNNNIPHANAGIEIAYRFASPDNKVNTGPIERFKTLFDNQTYAPMLNHFSLDIGPTQDYQSSANVPIIITDNNGKKAAYIFRLNKQTDVPYENCWMTSAVVRIPVDDPV